MTRITLSGTDLSVSRLSFGTARIHHIRRSGDRQTLLARALDEGFSHFDTAPYYGYGIAEKELGRFLSAAGRQATVATKIGLYPPLGQTESTSIVWLQKALGRIAPRALRPIVDWSVGRANKSLESSLRNLRRDCVDLLLLHEPDIALVDTDEFLAWLERQRTAGRLRYWGLAGSADQFGEWIRRGHALAHVIQARDSIDSATDWQGLYGRVPQITFGYLSSQHGAVDDDRVAGILRRALQRNPLGTVLISTRRRERISALASVGVEAA